MKKGIGILSIILFFIVEFDSCAVDLVNLFGCVKKVDGTAGMVLGLFMLAAGIISLCSKVYKLRVIAAISFYFMAVIIGYYNIDSYNEIKVWMFINLIFAVMLLVNLTVKWDKCKFVDYTVYLSSNISLSKDEKLE